MVYKRSLPWLAEQLSTVKTSLPLLTQATSLTTSVCPATVITAFPSTDQILAVLSYDPVKILKNKTTKHEIKLIAYQEA